MRVSAQLTPLLGRDAEVAAIRVLLEGARNGQSGVVCVTGEAGIGKSALLDCARGMDTGFVTLDVQGAEAESDLAYAGLSQLVLPLRDHIDGLPEPQREALRSALAMTMRSSGDRFATSAALLGVLAAAAEGRPLLVLVEDAHWLDRASADALAFACRRLEAEGIAVVIAARSLDGTPLSGLPQTRLEGLALDATTALLQSVAGHPVDAGVARHLREGTGGSPLALVEMARLLGKDQLAGWAPLEDPLPIGAQLERWYGQEFEALSASARRALLIIAASGGRTAGLSVAAELLGVEGFGAIEAAELSGLVTLEGGRVVFRHPLARSACYHRATPAERREAHRMLAGIEEDEAARAWHLAAAAAGADEQVAGLLESTAERARERNAHTEAARAFERAGRLSSDSKHAARRFLEAARDLIATGSLDRAVGLLDESQKGNLEPAYHLEAQRLRAQVQMWQGHPLLARHLLIEEAERCEASEPETAAALYVEALFPSILAGDLVVVLDTADRAARVGDEGHPLIALARGTALTIARRELEARPFLLRATEFMAQADPLTIPTLFAPATLGLACAGEYDRARALVTRLVGAAQSRGLLGVLPLALSMAAAVDFWTGRWRSAYANGTEAVRLSEATGQELGSSLTWLLLVEAGMGLEADARRHAQEATESIGRTGDTGILCWLHAALGRLELGLGRYDAAIAEFEESQRALLGGAGALPEWVADLAEAQIRAGRHTDAREQIAWLQTWARENEHTVGLGLAARTQLIAGGDAEVDRWHQEALASFASVDLPFERARTDLYYGERLRRAKRLQDARGPLSRALDAFARLGAGVWQERARAELRACGGAVADAQPAPLASLTGRELQVALTIASGASNREAAAQLLLSTKTVAFHLNNIYRKLGVRTRLELAVLLSAEGSEPDGSPLRPLEGGLEGGP